MSAEVPLVLHGYWRSGTSYRTRIALNLKQLVYEQVTHDLRTGEHKQADYLARNPQGLVPALETPDGILTQSSAIIEWLEERFPEPPLLPVGLQERALVRAMAASVACDIHPLNNLRVLQSLRQDLGADENAVSRWIARWIVSGFEALEIMIGRYGGDFCFGDAMTIADCHLIPQVYSAERFSVDLAAFPHVLRVTENARALDPVRSAHPDRQPDAS